MVVVIPLVPSSLGGSPEQWQARLLDYAGGERLQGTIESVVEDTTPQLGGNLDMNGNLIVDGAQDILEWTGSVLNILGNPLFEANVNNPADGHVLRYNSGSADWRSSALWAVDVQYDDLNTAIGESDVQGAIEWLVNNGGGGGGGGLNSVYGDKSPQLGGILQLGHPSESSRDFQDHNGNGMIQWGSTASAVNYFQMSNAATGNPPTLRAHGGDTNIDLQLLGKGTGSVRVLTTLKMSGSDPSIIDANEAKIMKFHSIASAVNWIRVQGAAAAGSCSILTEGSDTDVDLVIDPKGAGRVGIGGDIDLRIADQTIYDRFGNEMLHFNELASSVNYLGIGNAITGGEPYLFAQGDDALVKLRLSSKGQSSVDLMSHSLSNTLFRAVPSANPVNYVQVQSSDTGSGPILRATGGDTNSDLIIAAAGTGLVKIGGEEVMHTPAPSNGDIWYYNGGFQRLAKGTDGQVLQLVTGLPSWETGAGGSGDMTKAVYDPANIAEQLVGLTATQTLTNKTLTSAQVNTGLNDTNGNELLTVSAVGSAVNHIQIGNAITSAGPYLLTDGPDTNIDLRLLTKGGSGLIRLEAQVRLYNELLLGALGNTVLQLDDVTSAVNYPKLFNAATGNSVGLEAIGTDANIDVEVTPKGTGRFKITDGFEFQLGNDLVRGNSGNRVLTLTDAGDDNRIDIISIGAGSAPIIRAIGTDTNVDIKIYGKGSGEVIDLEGAQFQRTYEAEIIGTTAASVGSSEATAQLASMTQWGGSAAADQYTLSTVNDDVEVPIAGDYEIVAALSVDKSDSGASWVECKIQTDATGSFADVANTDFRNDVAGNSSGEVVTRCTITLADGDKVRLRHNSGTTTQSVRQLRMHIRRICS